MTFLCVGRRMKIFALWGRKTTFSSFSEQLQTNTYEAVVSHPHQGYVFCPGCCALLIVGGMGFIYKIPCSLVDLCSWNFIRMLCMNLYVREHKNLWKRWQHHPIFCVYGTFPPPQKPSSLHTHIFRYFLQPLVYLSQHPDFSEALKNFVHFSSLLLMRVKFFCFSLGRSLMKSNGFDEKSNGV